MLEEALERFLWLGQMGILQKINHSGWTASVVVIPKGEGCLRICGEYKVTVNPAE